MYIFELVQPGCWLKGIDDKVVQGDVESLLHLLSNCISDAALALSLFEESQALESVQHGDRKTEWEEDRQRERAIVVRLEGELPDDLDYEARRRAEDQIRELAAHEAKRQKWQEGRVPDEYINRLPFLHAKSFVYALDTLQKSMELLASMGAVPPGVSDAWRDFKAAFPDLVHVRNSAHHIEERVQGKHWAKRIDLKPLSNDAFHAPNGGVLISDMLMGRRYGGTLADGRYGEVEISAETVTAAQGTVQRVLNAFDWTGPAMHMPR